MLQGDQRSIDKDDLHPDGLDTFRWNRTQVTGARSVNKLQKRPAAGEREPKSTHRETGDSGRPAERTDHQTVRSADPPGESDLALRCQKSTTADLPIVGTANLRRGAGIAGRDRGHRLRLDNVDTEDSEFRERLTENVVRGINFERSDDIIDRHGTGTGGELKNQLWRENSHKDLQLTGTLC